MKKGLNMNKTIHKGKKISYFNYDTEGHPIFTNGFEPGKNKNLVQLNQELAFANARSATIVAEMEEKNEELKKTNKKLANANARSAELMAKIEEKNDELVKTNNNLAKANVHAAELMAVIELKDEEINKLNKSLAEVNARSANLVARRELQVVNIRELNRELQYEIEVRQKTEENLKKSNDAKDRFFSIIAHDLRNPVISFVNLANVLKEHSESFSKEEIIELIGDLHSSAENTQVLLENLLEWARSQTNRLEVKPETYRLKSIYNESVLSCQQHANSKNIQIETKIDDDISIWADKNLICTVIRNLISNAIKFSENKSKVLVNAEVKNGNVVFSIKDHGIGISPKKLEKMFRVDSKMTSQGTNNEKGSGLGLILCKEFIEKNGGKINVESKPGEGSIFSFTVPSAGRN